MCGITGAVSLDGKPIPNLQARIKVMNKLIAHRGPDGEGIWTSSAQTVGFGHRRLAVIDLGEDGAQPMHSQSGKSIVYNGEIYNYKEVRGIASNSGYRFKTDSDTESILAAHDLYGNSAMDHLRGMFAYAIWDESIQSLTLVRDRFGIKPLYYACVENVLYFASEAKALLPMLEEVKASNLAMGDYFSFQYNLGEETLFSGIHQLLPGQKMSITRGQIHKETYWQLQYEPNYSQTEAYFIDGVRQLSEESMNAHLVSDVEVGAYVSGGLDSSIVASMAARITGEPMQLFHGRFDKAGFDESEFALQVAEGINSELNIVSMGADVFEENIRNVIYHLDYPVGGPGSLPQYMVSEASSKHVKVILGGQGGDEIFGGYARYMVAYLEQTLKAAIDGTNRDGNFVVTLEKMVNNLGVLKSYKPLIQDFWSSGLFGPQDERFLRLIDRSRDVQAVINPEIVKLSGAHERFMAIFNDSNSVRSGSYFDKMTNFELKTLLPALLQVEDRMSMAHGLESRVPFLDHKLAEFVATAPADIKFGGGQLKHLLVASLGREVPTSVAHRKDKMGFPVPINDWATGAQQGFIEDLLANSMAKQRSYLNPDANLLGSTTGGAFSRGLWGLVSLELWHQEFVDNSSKWKQLLKDEIESSENN